MKRSLGAHVFFVSDHMTVKDFIAQIICLISRFHTSEPLSRNIGDEIINFVKESKELLSKLNTACQQVFNGRKQQSCNVLSRLMGYSAIFGSCGKNSDLDMEMKRKSARIINLIQTVD